MILLGRQAAKFRAQRAVIPDYGFDVEPAEQPAAKPAVKSAVQPAVQRGHQWQD